MKFVKFEGTVEELQAAYPFLTDAVTENSEHPVPPQPIPTPSTKADKPSEVTEEAAELFLKRRPFPKNQVAILKALLNANEDQGLKSSELATSIGCTVTEVQGSMRAFGKRAAHTEGWPVGRKAFKWKWLGSEMLYRLHPAMRTVLMSGRASL